MESLKNMLTVPGFLSFCVFQSFSDKEIGAG